MAQTPICSVDGCNKPARARGWCDAHYQRYRRFRDPLSARPLREHGVPANWLRDHAASPQTSCILWPFGRNGEGYGTVDLGAGSVLAHRAMCEMVNGPAPTPQHHAAHSCGNGKNGCVNPNHIRWATAAENEADKIDHGRTNRGERCGTAKLTAEDVHFIRRMRGRATLSELSALFGTTTSNISQIWNRKSWAWLP